MTMPALRAALLRVAAPGLMPYTPSVEREDSAVPSRSRKLFFAGLFAAAALPMCSQAQSLQVTYGSKGVQTIAYGGTVLEDVGANPGDAFHIWHMKATDLSGNTLYCQQCGWGETNNGTSWNAGTQTETYYFWWGSIQAQFVQQGNNLNVVVTETNNAGSGIVFDGAEIYPFSLHFPQDPKNFSSYSQYAITTTGPGVSSADFGTGVVTSVIPDESIPMYGGWKAAGGNTYSPSLATTAPDGLASFLPRIDRPVQPGTSFTYTVSLRFTPEGSAADASDAYASFAATYPSLLNWADRRIIGTAYLASSPASNGDKTQPGGFPNNPRRWFGDSSIDITTPSGLRAFQDRVLSTASANVTNTTIMNGQGVMTWDIEGEQYPQDTSYVCSPDQIATVAPEMETAVLNPGSPYFGQKLDDAYYKTMTSAGLRVGVCLRPQVFTLAPNGTASQNFLGGNAAIVANLENKARIANSRWGATMFYIDSAVDQNGGALDPAIYQQLITDLPSFLFIPEESVPRDYAYTAPFYTFLFHTDLGTDASVYNYYPNAFGANLVNDVDTAKLLTYVPQLTQAVSRGDILMGHAEFLQANDPILIAIYQAAGRWSLAPLQVTPSIQWATPASITYGTPLSAAQLNASANTAGSYVYTPGAGTVLGAGTQPLTVTFTPADTKDYRQSTATVNLQVKQATPVVSWATPAPITEGTALDASQLNATANVPGTFSYSPAAGTVPAAGTTTLQVTFTPSDAVNYASASASARLTVNPAVTAPLAPTAPTAPTAPSTPVAPATPVQSGPLYIVNPGTVLSGTVLLQEVCNLALDAAGTFLMVDGQQFGPQRFTGGPFLYFVDTRALNNGTHTLQLWAHDIGNNTVISAPMTVTVNN